MKRITMSFGTAAMRDGSSVLQVADVLYEYYQAGQQIIAVVAALEGVTDLLAESIRISNYTRVYNKLLSMHQSIARKLIRDERDRALLIQDITDILESYNWLGRSMVNRTPTPAETATILAIGERLSARLLTGHFQNRGLRATVLNGSELLITDDHYEAAAPDAESTQARVQARLLPRLEEGYLVLIGGGIGGTMDGKITRLANTDLSDTLLAVASQSEALWLWADRDGIMTADPVAVPTARTITTLSRMDMDDLALYGLKLPSSQLLAPVINAGIAVFIRNIYNPAQSGTYIQPDPNPVPAAPTRKLRALTLKDRLRVIIVSGPHLDPERGLNALHRQQTQALFAVDTPGEIAYFVSAAEVNSSRLTLEDAFRPNQGVCQVQEGQVGLITLIGADNSLKPHIESLLQSRELPLVRIVNMQHGDGRSGLSVVVPADHLRDTATLLHDTLLLS
ncbi:MAG: hypothetical protein K8L99_15735 [Anaerolineae bacterium]|nr:hypothetical protein [Anaerolineae bacterium]